MSAGASELYVYYGVAASSLPATVDAVRALQRRLCAQHLGLKARVLQRSDDTSEFITLMEIYAFEDGAHRGIDDTLRAHIDAAASVVAAWLIGPRHVECFDALD